VRSRTARVMMTLMRNGRDRRSENPFRATRGKNACLCLGPISGSHQGQRPQRLHSKAGYMAAPERFAETSDSFPLHRGRRPYMHRGRRPYMARSCGVLRRSKSSAIEVKPQGKSRRTISASHLAMHRDAVREPENSANLHQSWECTKKNRPKTGDLWPHGWRRWGGGGGVSGPGGGGTPMGPPPPIPPLFSPRAPRS
jgi:hypothetical protein